MNNNQLNMVFECGEKWATLVYLKENMLMNHGSVGYNSNVTLSQTHLIFVGTCWYIYPLVG